MEKRQQIQVLARLGWGDRGISRQTGVNQETIAMYRKSQADSPKVPPPTPGMPTGKVYQKCPPTFLCPEKMRARHYLTTHNPAHLPYLEFIREELNIGLTAQRIYQDLVERNVFRDPAELILVDRSF
jgi:hypothetical protein